MDLVVLIAVGVVSGFLTAYFGLGGALTVVPALILILPCLGVSPILVVHSAVSTSLAVMLFNNLVAFIVHQRYQCVDWKFFYRLALSVVLGSLLGVLVVLRLPAHVVLLVYSGFVLFVIVRFLLRYLSKSEITQDAKPANNKLFLGLNAFIAGLFAVLIGGGASIIMVPYLKRWGYLMRSAVAIVTMLNLCIATVATVVYSLVGVLGVGVVGNQFSSGLIYWPAAVGLLLGSVFGLPLGVRLSKCTPERLLTLFYAILLGLVLIIILLKLMRMFF